MAKKKWIAGAIEHPGSLRRKAKRAGLIKGDEELSAEDIAKLKKSKNATTAKQANLAATLKKMRRRKKKK